ncbi:MAG: acyltransferase [Treponema sp.]|jgi:hypothetical protein|nr:acyltransferase [Treponema sp.]
MEMDNKRKYYIDNIRLSIVVLVIVYHVVYVFNSVGVARHIDVTGIPQFDVLCYFVYPWLMTILFLLAGVSSHFALQKRTVGKFVKERFWKLIIPFICGIFILGWINGWVLNHYVDIFGGNPLPVVIKYIVYCFAGMGPVWFLFQLFIVSMVLLLIRKIDKNDRLGTLARKSNLIIVIIAVLPFWGTSFLLNVPVITVFRNGIYLFSFLMGYYFFSNEKIIDMLEKYRFWFLSFAVSLGILTTYLFYGKSFVDNTFLQHPLINLYSWIMMLAIVGCSKKYFNYSNKILEYIKNRNFFWFLCHYPIMNLLAYCILTYLNINFIWVYVLLLIGTLCVTIIFSEIIRLVPLLRTLLFGIKNTK